MFNDLILTIKNLNVSLACNRTSLIDNLNLSIHRGEFIGLVGESGSGKSMTSQAILSLLSMETYNLSGEINFEGENLLKLPRNKLTSIRGAKIAYIPQDPMTSLNPLYTVGYQMVETIQAHQRINYVQSQVKAIKALQDVQIQDAKLCFNSYPHQLSGGMKQRIMIALALCLEPSLLIADEPTTALDVTVQAQILKLLSKVIKQKNMSVLLITHDLAIVSTLCTTVAVIYAGKIVEYTDTNTFFSNPKHPYSQGLLKSIPQTGQHRLIPIPGNPPELSAKIIGCNFSARCPIVEDRCLQVDPVLEEKSPNHKVKCWLVNNADLQIL